MNQIKTLYFMSIFEVLADLIVTVSQHGLRRNVRSEKLTYLYYYRTDLSLT